MGRAQRLAWERDGKPFRLMTPADTLAKRLRAHGYTVYGIGNEEHLDADPPEDHTPYSATGWPSKAKYGVGYAIDIMPPKAGAKSELTGKPLPSLQKLGAQLVKDRKAGVAGIKWLKYMNWEPERDWGGPCYQESWMPNHARRSSWDRGHIHMSGRTGYETSSVGDGYDPVARFYGEDEDDVKSEDIDKIVNAVVKKIKAELPTAVWGADIIKNPAWRHDSKTNSHVQAKYALERLLEGHGAEVMPAAREANATLAALTQAQAGVPAAEILAAAQANAERLSQLVELVASLAERTDDPAALTRIAEAVEQIAAAPAGTRG